MDSRVSPRQSLQMRHAHTCLLRIKNSRCLAHMRRLGLFSDYGQLFRAAWQEALKQYVFSEKLCPFQQLFSTSRVYNPQFFKGAICEIFDVLHQKTTLMAGQASRNHSVWKYAAAEWSVFVWIRAGEQIREQLCRRTHRCCSDRSGQVNWPRCN